jgi:hypothetical protein
MKVEKVYLMRNTGGFLMDLQARSSWREEKRKEEKKENYSDTNLRAQDSIWGLSFVFLFAQSLR